MRHVIRFIAEPIAAVCAFLRHFCGTDDEYELIDARRCEWHGFHEIDEACSMEGTPA